MRRIFLWALLLACISGCGADKVEKVELECEAIWFHGDNTKNGNPHWTFLYRDHNQALRLLNFYGDIELEESEDVKKPRIKVKRNLTDDTVEECILFLPLGYFDRPEPVKANDEGLNGNLDLKSADDWIKNYNR